MLIYCLSIDGLDLGGEVGWWFLMVILFYYISFFIVFLLFCFCKIIFVNKFIIWWVWFIGLKWMRGNLGYLSELENFCIIGLYRLV